MGGDQCRRYKGYSAAEQRQVKQLLKTIEGTRTGRELVTDIRESRKEYVIQKSTCGSSALGETVDFDLKLPA